MINTNKTLLAITLLTSLSFSTLTNAQSLSEAVFKNVAGKRFWQVQVNCDSTSPSQQLNQDISSDQWCINGSTDCFSDKQLAAEKACKKETVVSNTVQSKAVKQPSPIPSTAAPKPNTPLPTPIATNNLEEDDDDDYVSGIDYDALRKEKIELQANSLQIQQKILDLKRQEAELQRSISTN